MRKNLNRLAAVAALTMLLGTGCQKDDATATARSEPESGLSGTSSSASASPTRSTDVRVSGSTAADESVAAARDTVDSSARAVQGGADSAGSAVRDTAAGAQSATDVQPAAGAPTPAASGDASTAEAQKLLDQATQYIKENKWDLADKSLTQLEGMKSQLPASYGPKIDASRKMFNTAKSGSGLLGGSSAGGAAK